MQPAELHRATIRVARARRASLVGAIVAAIAASACCLVPAVLAVVGMSGVGFAVALAYRPIFLGATALALAAGFYFTCPICNLHLRRMAQRSAEIEAAGIHEVVLFHSGSDTMKRFQGDLPFDVVADPRRDAYDRYGVGSSPRSILDPRAWGAYFRGVFAKHPSSSMTGEGGHTGLPADFLITPEGVVHAVKYGAHADDQWSVDELLAVASASA